MAETVINGKRVKAEREYARQKKRNDPATLNDYLDLLRSQGYDWNEIAPCVSAILALPISPANLFSWRRYWRAEQAKETTV